MKFKKKIKSKFPKLFAIIKILIKKPKVGQYFNEKQQLSPDIKLTKLSEFTLFRQNIELLIEQDKQNKLKSQVSHPFYLLKPLNGKGQNKFLKRNIIP